jgi:hypothetical protein
MSITVTVETEIPIERIKDLLCAAFEGGIDYWGNAKSFIGQKEKLDAEYFHEIPALGGVLVVFDNETDEELGKIDMESMKQAFEYMANGTDKNGTDYPRLREHLADFLNENEDATTADVFVQLAVMGEVVFG